MRLEGTDIEGYLAHQHDMIILTAIEEARQGAEDHVQEMQRRYLHCGIYEWDASFLNLLRVVCFPCRWAAAEWAQARHKFMESLGHRAYRWEGQAVPTPAKADSSFAAGGGVRSSSTPFTPFAKRGDIFSPQTPGFGADRSAAVATPGTARSSLYGQSSVGRVDLRPSFSELVTNQARVIRRLNQTSHSSGSVSGAVGLGDEPAPTPGSVKPYLHLAAGIRVPDGSVAGRVAVTDGLSKADLVAYRAHLQLLASAVGEANVQRASTTTEREGLIGGRTATRQVPANFPAAAGDTGVPPPGYFSGLCLDPTDISPTSVSAQFQSTEERRQWLTVGSKSYLEAQYWDVLSHSLDEAVTKEGWAMLASVEGSSRQQRLRSFVAYQQHARQLPVQCARVLASTGSGPVEMRMAATPSVRGGLRSPRGGAHGQTTIPLWVFVFQCLRVGDLGAAVTELSACLAQGHIEGGAAAVTVLQTLTQLLQPAAAGGRGAFGGAASGGAARHKPAPLPEHEARAAVDAMLQCRAQYERESKEDEATQDPFRAVVFNLLGLANKEDLAGNGLPGYSLEDFLWAHLWFVQYVRLLQSVLPTGAFSTPFIARYAYSSCIYNHHVLGGLVLFGDIENSERTLFELMLEYGGPDYFDQDRTNPFRYAMVLVCCQRFGDAIAHLWQCNKIVPAVHLTSVALHYGLVLPHVPLDMNPAHPMVMGGRFVHGSAYATTQDPTPASILQFFATTPLVAAHPAVVTDYLVSLDSNWLTHAQGIEPELKETMKLKSQTVVSSVLEGFISSLTREQLDEVVGQPTDATVDAKSAGLRGEARTNGRLDEYLSRAQVELLLARAAYHLLTQRKEAEAAVYLYLLAGRYSEVVEALCTQLGAVLIPTSHSSNNTRVQWHTLSENFIERYLQPSADHAQTLVLFTLKQTGGGALVDALLLLTSLFQYVDEARDSSVHPLLALRHLDQLQVLPATPEQIDQCASYTPFLQPAIDDLLLLTMELTTQAFHTLQQERANQSATASGGAGNFAGLLTECDVHLRACKTRASAVAQFAQRVRGWLNRQDTAGVLARMEAAIA